MQWFAQAPANIALIKYMGKIDVDNNSPTNSSLSYTLTKLLSSVAIETTTTPQDRWESLDTPGGQIFMLSASQQQRFLNHLAFLKNHFGDTHSFIVRSCNNFPDSNGLASSASSFAALTLCAVRTLCELTAQKEPSMETIAKLSQHGSGSSCRSLFSPWALWQDDHVSSIDLPYPDLIHHVIITSHDRKTVSSSEAHQRVLSSPLFNGRIERAEQRLKLLIKHLKAQDWQACYELVWQEFWDMHQLFETAAQPFSYMNDTVKAILNDLQAYWGKHGDGPLITMDAGPNIHLLFRPEQDRLAFLMQRKYLKSHDVI